VARKGGRATLCWKPSRRKRNLLLKTEIIRDRKSKSKSEEHTRKMIKKIVTTKANQRMGTVLNSENLLHIVRRNSFCRATSLASSSKVKRRYSSPSKISDQKLSHRFLVGLICPMSQRSYIRLPTEAK
jgi:hypothetical protein